jgi:FAD/FMN-containing dehydrogenase
VKGGGHAENPGFSSTRGVQIAITRFNETKVDSTSGTVYVGAGLTWDQVYDALDQTGVTVIGGRIPGIGVAGLTLGGGECLGSSESPADLIQYLQAIHISQVSTDLRLTTLRDMNSCSQMELSHM